MKDLILNILDEYLLLFDEKERQTTFINYLNSNEEVTDWNNFNGHVVSSGFVYARQENKFLVLYHNDFKTYIYPGGHVDDCDINPLETAKREIKEETGIDNLKLLKLSKDELIPIDIDTHKIEYNEKLNLPQHYHFDFRYLFMVDKITAVKIDIEESSDYKWISLEELSNDSNYKNVIDKIKQRIIML